MAILPLTEAVFARPEVRAALERLLAQVDVAPERRTPERTLHPPSARDARLSFVAWEGDELVGFVTAHESPYAPGAVFVPWLVVDEAARGRGLGGDLLRAVLAAGKAHGFRIAALYVGDDNLDAQAFYDRVGGERVRLMPPRDDAEVRRGAQWIYRWILD
jgi:ribosomal protein S18 acetylase RimI-like enzyme